MEEAESIQGDGIMIVHIEGRQTVLWSWNTPCAKFEGHVVPTRARFGVERPLGCVQRISWVVIPVLEVIMLSGATVLSACINLSPIPL